MIVATHWMGMVMGVMVLFGLAVVIGLVRKNNKQD